MANVRADLEVRRVWNSNTRLAVGSTLSGQHDLVVAV
jgi:hypothetical protein